MSRQIAKLITLLMLFWLPQAQAAIAIKSARVWPAQDYTRLTLESAQPLNYKMFTVDNPARLVVDLDQVDLHGLDGLTKKVGDDDPYIKSVRVGQFKPDVVRVVLDLKTQVKPQLFSLKPVANYGYRLVLDIYPASPPPADPLMALLDDKPAAASSPIASKTEQEDVAAQQDSTPDQVAAAPAVPAKPEAEKTTDKPVAAKSQPEISARTLIIVVDAGHGGEDPGAHGKHGTFEKNVTLAIARKLKKLIDNSDGMRGVLTRDGDYFIPLGMRVVKARNAHADLFVSIHADSYVKSNASGSSVFALSDHGATSAAARWLAKKENEADLIGGVNIAVKDPYLARTLLDLSQTATISDSLKLGKYVLGELGDINNLHRGFVEQAGFAVLKAPDIPSILVETAFISNPDEERKLRSEKYQDEVAQAILVGIKRYFAQNPPISRRQFAQAD